MLNNCKDTLNTFMTLSLQDRLTAARLPSTISDSVNGMAPPTSALVKNFSVVLNTNFKASSLYCQFYDARHKATLRPKTFSILLSISTSVGKSFSSIVAKLIAGP
jgi:hypothetical protein